jgi:Zn-dependent M28 family amino/carboxypeptidase
MNTSILFVFASVVLAQAPPLHSLDPRIQRTIGEVSEANIAASMKKLESFGTRNPHMPGSEAARAWIVEQFKGYSPKLEVKLDKHPVKKGGRFARDLDVVNIVATLPGKSEKDRHVIVGGHYDSMVTVRKKDTSEGAKPDATVPDWETTAEQPSAPGVSDDASGTAVTLELARVMSQYEWEKTLVFIAFDAEEEGLIGSNRYSEDAKKAGMIVDGVLNNDIVGNDVGGDGKKQTARVYVFSDDPPDSPSRSLARYIKETSERYLPAMTVDLVYRADRFARGGDHSSFHNAGFPAVRFTTEVENYKNQHTVTDTFENSSPAYTANVARVNCAAAASLALAPAAPEVTREATTGLMKGRRVPMLARGKSGYDAELKWTDFKDNGPVAGYVVKNRRTTAPDWQYEWYVGAVHEFTFTDTSIDDVVFGVRAVGKDGNESPVAAYVLPHMIFEAQP